MLWKTLYVGSSEQIQRQIVILLHRAGIPYRVSGGGIKFGAEIARFCVQVRRGDYALAILVLKKHRKNKNA